MPYRDRAAHREEIRAYNAAYRAAHREERRAKQAARNAARRESHTAWQRAYDAAHREEKRAYDAAHREEKRAYHAAYGHGGRRRRSPCVLCEALLIVFKRPVPCPLCTELPACDAPVVIVV